MNRSPLHHGRRLLLILGVAGLVLVLGGTALANFPATGDGWHQVPIQSTVTAGGFGPVACPSRSLCLGPGGSTPGSIVRGDPLGGSASWTQVPALLPAQTGSQAPQSISCPSMRVCAIAYTSGIVAATSTPDGTTPWATTTVTSGYLYRLSCTPQGNLCVATGQQGIYASTDPASSQPTWRQINRAGRTAAVSCPSAHLCAVVGRNHRQVLVTTNPTARTVRWSTRTIPGRSIQLSGISCATNHLCVAVDGDGRVISSTRPTGSAETWKTAYPLAKRAKSLLDVSCVPAHLCISSENGYGKILLSNDPTGGKRAWREETIGRDEQSVTAQCQSSTLCVAEDDHGDLLYNTNPTRGLRSG